MYTLRSARPPRRAFTLVEASVATLIVGVMVAAGIAVVGNSAKAARLERNWRRADALAGALMSEILSLRFTEPGGSGSIALDTDEKLADRTTMDDVDDFDNYTESPPSDHAGVPISWATGWTRSVIVENVNPATPTTPVADGLNTGLKRITVTVTNPTGQSRSITALKARTNPVDARAPRLNAITLTHVRIQMRAGAAGSLLVGGADLFNTPVGTLAAAPEDVK